MVCYTIVFYSIAAFARWPDIKSLDSLVNPYFKHCMNYEVARARCCVFTG